MTTALSQRVWRSDLSIPLDSHDRGDHFATYPRAVCAAFGELNQLSVPSWLDGDNKLRCLFSLHSGTVVAQSAYRRRLPNPFGQICKAEKRMFEVSHRTTTTRCRNTSDLTRRQLRGRRRSDNGFGARSGNLRKVENWKSGVSQLGGDSGVAAEV